MNLFRNVKSLQNYTHPLNPNTKISYSLLVAGPVKIIIYNTLGQQVRVLINEEQDAGQYNIEWNSRNGHNQTLSSGVYTEDAACRVCKG